MGKKLVIVESPSKSKTIEKYLGSDFKVVASKGHIRDLATSGKFGLGVDVENDFAPNYINVKGKTNLIKELKKDVKDSDFVYLATDPDREGEAISWHLKEVLGINDKNYSRVLFHEITKDKVIDAINNPTVIDDNLVRSQETRRILDRIIGFRLSKLLQRKIGAKSAGRVQSVALKLIVDREREIEAFKEEEYWTIAAKFNDKNIESTLFKYNDKDVEIKNEEEADKILDSLNNKFIVEEVVKKDALKKSKFPFTTSTMQQDASNKLGFPAKKTMSVAQKLYEGIDIGSETTGLITYMRTDSIRLSDEFIKQTYKFIDENYGKEYVGYTKKSKKNDNVQDAHEAIRPTSINRTPESLKKYLSNDEYKLYNMIYKRALASLMADAKVDKTTVVLDNNSYKFKTTGQTLKFPGYLKVYGEFEDSEDKVLPTLEENEVLETNDIEKTQHFTKPPARYTEAKLIKEMEELGIGRPSTYAKIIDTIKERNYVEMIEKKFAPTEVGIETTDKLQENFSDLINVKYTANMEDDLDRIADGKLIWNKVLKDFYDVFEPRVEEAFTTMEKKEAEKTGETCPNCGNPLVIRKGRYGEFVACSNYPECKYIKKEEKKVVELMPCPKCDGTIVEKKTRKGKIFYGCSNYPKCDFALWDKPIDEKCPNCGEILVEHKDQIKCSKCDYVK